MLLTLPRTKNVKLIRENKDLEENYRLMKQIYTDIRNPASFSGINQFLREAKLQIDLKITRREVVEFLHSNMSYVMHYPVKRRVKSFRQVIAKHIDSIWSCDLMFFQALKRYNSFYTCLLVTTDVLSGYIIAISPLKNKSAQLVSQAFVEIFQNTGRKPKKLLVDLGYEFYSMLTMKTFKQNNIEVYSVSTPQKSSIAERTILKIRILIGRYLTFRQNFKYVDQLENIRMSLNERPNRVIGMSPAAVTIDNQAEVFKLRYKNTKFKVRYKFRAGDYCRTVNTGLFRKSSRHSVSRLRFRIRNVLDTDAHMYQLELPGTGELIDRSYYSPELVLDKTNSSEIPKAFPVLNTRPL